MVNPLYFNNIQFPTKLILIVSYFSGLNILKWFVRLLLKIKPFKKLIKILLSKLTPRSIPPAIRFKPNENYQNNFIGEIRKWCGCKPEKNIIERATKIMVKKRQEKLDELEKARLINIEKSVQINTEELAIIKNYLVHNSPTHA